MGFLSIFSRNSRDSALSRSDQKTLRKGCEVDVVLVARRLVDQNHLEQALGVLKLAEGTVAFARLTEVGARLRDESRAEVLVLGCAAMARYRARLEAALGVPVIDPTQAAVALAIAAVRLNAGTGRRAAE